MTINPKDVTLAKETKYSKEFRMKKLFGILNHRYDDIFPLWFEILVPTELMATIILLVSGTVYDLFWREHLILLFFMNMIIALPAIWGCYIFLMYNHGRYLWPARPVETKLTKQ